MRAKSGSTPARRSFSVSLGSRASCARAGARKTAQASASSAGIAVGGVTSRCGTSAAGSGSPGSRGGVGADVAANAMAATAPLRVSTATIATAQRRRILMLSSSVLGVAVDGEGREGIVAVGNVGQHVDAVVRVGGAATAVREDRYGAGRQAEARVVVVVVRGLHELRAENHAPRPIRPG